MTQTFGKYQLEQLIAVGGMAEVFLARQSGPAGFEKQLVVKRILPQFASDANFIHMFLDEARLAAQLSHPNLVQIFELGEAQGTYYIAMEHIDGETLADVIDRANALGVRLPYHYAARIIAQVCAGLDYAHHFTSASGEPLNLVHRDISPDNVLVSWTGAVKTIDFGIAKAQTNRTRTQSGAVKGKFCYMSPEQVMGKPLDGRSDLFSVGIVLYELVTGARPFGDDAGLMAVSSIVNEAPRPLRDRARDIPEALEAIILKALAKDPDERYARARDLQRDLETFIQTHARFVNDSELGELLQALRRGEARDVTFVKRLQREVITTVDEATAGQEVSGNWRSPGPVWRVGEPEARSATVVGATAAPTSGAPPAGRGSFRRAPEASGWSARSKAIVAGVVGAGLGGALLVALLSRSETPEDPPIDIGAAAEAPPNPTVAEPVVSRAEAVGRGAPDLVLDEPEDPPPTAALGSLEPLSARFGEVRLPPVLDGPAVLPPIDRAADDDVAASPDGSGPGDAPDAGLAADEPDAEHDTGEAVAQGPDADRDGDRDEAAEGDPPPKASPSFGTIRGEGKLIVESNVVGAEVWANGRKLGQTPLRSNLFDGTYDVEVKAGPISWKRDGVRIEYGGTSTLNARLSAGRLELSAIPLGVLCTLDGVLMSRAQFEGQFVSAGTHEVECDDPARGKASAKVSVRAGQTERVNLSWD